MKLIREIVAVFLATISLVSVPIGIFALVGGFLGKLADAEYSLNVTAGLTLFLLCFSAPAGLCFWVWLWRGKW